MKLAATHGGHQRSSSDLIQFLYRWHAVHSHHNVARAATGEFGWVDRSGGHDSHALFRCPACRADVKNAPYFPLVSRNGGVSARVKTTISSPVITLMS